MFLLVSLLVIFSSFTAMEACDDQRFDHSVILNSAIGFTLEWSLPSDADTIILRLTANLDQGWLGLGLSEAGHMLGSDIVTVRFDPASDAPVAEDRFVNWAASPNLDPFPILDECQDWTLVCGSRTAAGISQYIITRALRTQDTQDRDFKQGISHLVFAWGTTNSEVQNHGTAQRGTIALDFFNQTSLDFVPPGDASSSATTKLIISHTVDATSSTTQYVLQKFDLGITERHVVAVNLSIRAEDRAYVHHMLLHDCGGELDAFPLNLSPLGQPLVINEGASPLFLGACQGLVFSYGSGGSGQVFPDTVGYRLNAQTRYLVLEMHLDFPHVHSGLVILSGLELFTTLVLREHDAGTLVLADAYVKFGSIPALQSTALLESICPAACTNKFAGEITLIRSFPHMHSFGREIWTTLHDGAGNEQGRLISSRKFWNAGTQISTAIPVGTKVKPGDWLSTKCVYDTSKSPSNVLFGLSSKEEMCMDFVMYYPKQNGTSVCGFLSTSTTSCGKDELAWDISLAPVGNTVLSVFGDDTGAVPATCDFSFIEPTPTPIVASPSNVRRTATPTAIVAAALFWMVLTIL